MYFAAVPRSEILLQDRNWPVSWVGDTRACGECGGTAPRLRSGGFDTGAAARYSMYALAGFLAFLLGEPLGVS